MAKQAHLIVSNALKMKGCKTYLSRLMAGKSYGKVERLKEEHRLARKWIATRNR